MILFRSIIVFCGTNNILQSIHHIQFDVKNVVSPTKQCYESEYCYEPTYMRICLHW